MAFFGFTQNNSGGVFVHDPKAGVGSRVIIEADTQEAAVQKAESLDLYFNGVESGKDCQCCGDRWSDWPDEMKEAPTSLIWIWAKPDETPPGYVHYQDGRIVRIGWRRGAA